MIELQDITVALPPGKPGAETIIDRVDMMIERGDWVALAGPNGSGKTTLLRTIAGLVPARSGVVEYASHDRPSTALLLQEPDNQFVTSSVRNELVLSVPSALDDEASGERVDAAVEQFALGAFLERNPHRLSGGEKQRLALATVWLSDPEVLLLDEPTSYLDATERRRCVDFVRGLNDAGVTIVWATPGGEELEAARRLVYLNDGRVRFDGTREAFAKESADGDFELVEPTRPLGTKAVHVQGLHLGGAASPLRDDAIVALDRVSFAYDDAAVLTDVSLAIAAGECVGITGRNGSGKSTLLGLMSGVLDPTTGTIRRAFVKAVDHGRQNVFFLFQSPERLFFAETVFEEVAFGLRSLGVPRKELGARVAETLARVGLKPDEFADRLPFSLSFGEMRRVAFAIARALRPRLVLLDEPAASLDASGRDILGRMIEDFRSNGSAVVLASHNPDELGSVVDRWVTL
jgi:energy-coupling factor transport system ATP-binding protein